MCYNKSIANLQRDAGCFRSISVYAKHGSFGMFHFCDHWTIAHDSPTWYCFIYQLQTVRSTGLSCLSIDWMVLTVIALIAYNNQMHRYDCTFPVKNWTREGCYCQPPPHSCSLVKDKVLTKAFGTVYVQTPVTTPWKDGISVTQVHSGNSPVCGRWRFSFLFLQLRSMEVFSLWVAMLALWNFNLINSRTNLIHNIGWSIPLMYQRIFVHREFPIHY